MTIQALTAYAATCSRLRPLIVDGKLAYDAHPLRPDPKRYGFGWHW
jgi:hypothetical protein